MFRHPNPIHWLSALVLAIGLLCAHHADAATAYTVGSLADGCSHQSLQDAIDDTVANVENNTIHVANSAAYTQIALVINDRNIAITGGYAHCADANPGTTKTVLDGANNGGHSVVALTGASFVQMQNFDVKNGQQGNDSHGGGFNHTGNGELDLLNVLVEHNSCGYGAGINISPSGGVVDLYIQDNTVISSNTAAHQGGGIRIEGNTVLHMSSLNNQISGNSAGDYGGGIAVLGSARADISSPASAPTNRLISQNSAGYGGGIAIVATSANNVPLVRLWSMDAGSPPRISYNAATNGGGGIYLQAYDGSGGTARANLCAYDFSIENNTAQDGAGILADEADNGSSREGTGVYLNTNNDLACFSVGLLPSGATRCTPGAGCNDISNNVSQTSGGAATDGAAVWVREAGKFYAQKVRFSGNRGGYTQRISTNQGVFADADTCLITDNHVSGALVKSDGNSPVSFENCTIANNIIGAPNLMEFDDDYTIRRSIVWQPGTTTIVQTDSGTAITQDVFKSDIFGCTPTSGCTVPLAPGDSPRFVDPAHADYHLQAGSQAVDFTAIVDSTDLDNHPRGIDLAQVSNNHGADDLGAYERQSLGNLVLNGDFDSDLRLWTNLSSGLFVTAFDATQNHSGAAGSGSAKVTYTPSQGGSEDGTANTGHAIVEVTGTGTGALSQCIALPNFGNYTLTGFDRRFGMSIGQNSTASLLWSEYDNSFNCSGTATRQGQLFLPYSNPQNWVAPAAAAEIASGGQAGQQFAHNASVLVTVTFDPATQSAVSAYFDGISLVPYSITDEIFADGFEGH